MGIRRVRNTEILVIVTATTTARLLLRRLLLRLRLLRLDAGSIGRRTEEEEARVRRLVAIRKLGLLEVIKSPIRFGSTMIAKWTMSFVSATMGSRRT